MEERREIRQIGYMPDQPRLTPDLPRRLAATAGEPHEAFAADACGYKQGRRND
jgi:hypothetical protein